MRLINSIKTILALSIVLLTIHSCTKDPETVLVEYINTFVITNSSSEAPDNSEATFSIWANGNVGGQLVKDGDYYLKKGETITITTSVSLPEGTELSYLLSPEAPEGCWQDCDYKSALTSYPSSNPKIQSGDQLGWNMISDQVSFNSNGPGGGSGTSCSDYYDFYDCGGNPAYMKIKLCKLSETSNTVTVSVDIQPNNAGLVGSSSNIMQIFYGDNTHEMTYGDFNSSGFTISSITIDKTIVIGGTTYNWDDTYNVYVDPATGDKKVSGIVVVWC
jgi:hypothetical protein